jgi:hypothetical protein
LETFYDCRDWPGRHLVIIRCSSLLKSSKGYDGT